LILLILNSSIFSSSKTDIKKIEKIEKIYN